MTMGPVNQGIQADIANSTLIGPAAPGKMIYVSINMEPKDPAALQEFVDAVSNPSSPSYRQWISPNEIGSMFGQSQSTVNLTVQYLRMMGFSIDLIAKDRMHILAHGTVAEAERAFAVHIDDFQLNTPQAGARTDYFSNTTVPMLPTQISTHTVYVAGLDNYSVPKPDIISVEQGHTLYNSIPELQNGFEGQGRTLAITNFDGFRLSNVPLLYAQYNLPTPPGGVGSNITVETVDGGAGSGTPGAEGDLDIQMVLGESPLCNFIIYDDGGPTIDVLTQEMNDNKADVISESYGEAPGSSGAAAEHQLHLEMNAEGITYLAASADSGTSSYGTFYYPQEDPEVLDVGGTVPVTDTTGNRQSETGWGGSGGGWAVTSDPFNVTPSYQVGNGVPTGIGFRLIPDVSLCAAGVNDGAWYFYLNGSLQNGYDGTSFAAPAFNGLLGIVEQAVIAKGGLPPDSFGNQRYGRINDLIYSQDGDPTIWTDITSGNNGTLPNGQNSSCTPFWDTVTGWGVINVDGFVNSVSVTPPTSVSPTSVSIYNNLGTSLVTSPNALTAVDGVYDSVNSVATATGNETALAMPFALTNTSNLKSITLTLSSAGGQGSTEFVYLYNNLKRRYDYVKAYPVTSSMQTNAFTISSFAPYVDSNGNVKMIVRDLLNARLGSAPFQFQLDYAGIGETF